VASKTEPVPLTRHFQQVSPDLEPDQAELIRGILSGSRATGWDDLLLHHRVVILADAGAGKTFEMRAQATALRNAGKRSFFLRIEDISDGLLSALDVGTGAEFEDWLAGTDDAYLFLDSVDEARLEHPRAFEKALRRVKDVLGGAHHRAHIYISSRPYAWRKDSDPALIERFFPFPGGRQDGDRKNELFVYWLAPLSPEAVRFYGTFRGASDIEGLIAAVERANLWSIAERPFDLEDILRKWERDRKLGTRLEMLRYGIDLRLAEIDPDRSDRQPLSAKQAIAGARQLAAAVSLTTMAGIRTSDGPHDDEGIAPHTLLPDWRHDDIKALLARALFNDAIYGMVRFRHREVRDLLSADWLLGLVKAGLPRQAIETLIFREQYGEEVIAPRLRSLLPWLMLSDSRFCERAVALDPAIATEGGDPAQLPIGVRRTILKGIAEQIADSEGTRRAGDNAAVARIAQADLSDDAARLIEQHRDNDDVLFFLARLVWQGEMAACIDLLEPIVLDNARGIYTRIVALRAIVSIGGPERRRQMWEALLGLPSPLDRRLLVELLQAAEPSPEMVMLLGETLGRLTPYERFAGTGLGKALHDFVRTVPTKSAGDGPQSLLLLIERMNSLLQQPPFIDAACEVSEANRWLLGLAVHAAERLIEARAPESFDPSVLGILLKVPAVRLWRSDDGEDPKSALGTLIPAWTELNDALFWASVEERRVALACKNEELTDDWPVSWIGHFWRFEIEDLSRLLSWIEDRTELSDRLVALGRAYRTFMQNGRPEEWPAKFDRAVGNSGPLREAYDRYLQEPDPEVLRRQRAEERRYKREMRQRERSERESHDNWVSSLRSDPGLVRRPPELEPHQVSNTQVWLLQSTYEEGSSRNHFQGDNWPALIPEFGEDVAKAYREATLRHWREYEPPLRSEGNSPENTPWAVLIGLAGLAIEPNEADTFPLGLSPDDARHAFRYAFWELNGFPDWFEKLYRQFPNIGLEAIRAELFWELENSSADPPMHYVLHDLVYYTPWLHNDLAPVLLEWLENRDPPHLTALRYCLHILVESGTPAVRLAELASGKLQRSNEASQRPHWYALWTDTDPAASIGPLKRELQTIDPVSASAFVQQFIVALTGGRHDRTPVRGGFMTPGYLKTLYELTYEHVRAADDVHRAGKGVYSPTLRDDAQDTRTQLFNWLADMPGKATYDAIAELARTHPDPESRKWMKLRARERAVADSDLTPWTCEQVAEFARTAELTPATHRQLFDLLLLRLADLRSDLEAGNASIAKTLQRVPAETEMRNVFASLMMERSHGRYALSQESELANAQRPDIWLQVPGVAPVPIEVKLLDQGWTGPALCERLRNQLAGDYLRDRQASCGIMLLIWQGRAKARRWRIGGKLVGLDQLQDALANHWRAFGAAYPGVEDVRIELIDLEKRATKSSDAD